MSSKYFISKKIENPEAKPIDEGNFPNPSPKRNAVAGMNEVEAKLKQKTKELGEANQKIAMLEKRSEGETVKDLRRHYYV